MQWLRTVVVSCAALPIHGRAHTSARRLTCTGVGKDELAEAAAELLFDLLLERSRRRLHAQKINPFGLLMPVARPFLMGHHTGAEAACRPVRRMRQDGRSFRIRESSR